MSNRTRLIVILGIIVLITGFCILGILNVILPNNQTTTQGQPTAAAAWRPACG